MLDFMLWFSTFVDSVAMTTAVLSSIWLYRQGKTLKTPYSAFSIVAILFTGYQFFAPYDTTFVSCVHEVIVGLFAIITITMNTYCSTYSIVNIGVNRREKQDENFKNTDRRKTPSKPICTK